MKITANNADSFIANSPETTRCFLVYGPDYGLVQERFQALKTRFVSNSGDPFGSTILDYDQLKKDPALLADEMGSISLFGGDKVILLKNLPPTPIKAITQQLATVNAGAMLLLSAGDLSPSSALRKLCEKEAHCAAIPCYKDDIRGMRQVISQFFRQHQLSPEAQAVEMLAANFGGDRLVILAELEKLRLYVGQRRNITLEDIHSCVMDSAELVLDELSHAIMSLNAKAIGRLSAKAFSEGATAVGIIRGLSRYVLRLIEAHLLVSEGTPPGQAAKMMRPPIFFKYQQLFTEHLQLWPQGRLEKLLTRLTALEKETKTTGMPAQLLCERFFIMIPLIQKSVR